MRWPTDGTRDLARLLADPESAHTLSPLQWEGVVTAGRETTLLGTLWHRLNQAQCQTAVPQAVAWHLRGAQRVADRQAEALRWELRELQDGMLQRMAAPILLKGAAYLLADLPNARGRFCNDIDLMFPEDQLERAESLLFFDGWLGSHHDEYDQRYYREWMHELPPLQHQRRGTTLDLHHNILPRTFRVTVDAERLWRHSQPLPDPWRFRVLCPVHRVLHCVVHLYSETDWDRGLRDLYDIHALIGHCTAEEGAGFWDALISEAETLGLGWLLARAVRDCQQRFRLPVPAEADRRLRRHQGLAALRPLRRRVFHYGLNTRTTRTPARDALARGLLFLRGHWLKMPPGLLVRHLTYKALHGDKDDPPTPQANQPEQHG